MTAEKRENRLRLLFVAVAACLIYAVNGGIRSNYGIMLGGIMESSGLPYDSVSLAVAVAQLMFGVTQPVFGVLALKKSNGFVLCLGTILVAMGLLMTPACHAMWSLMLFFGFLLPAGFGALSFGVIMGTITPILGQKTAATVSGIVSASSGMGSVVLSPVINLMLETSGLWGCMIALAVLAICLIPVTIWLSRAKGTDAAQKGGAVRIGQMLKTAFSTRSYYLLLFAFFTCGFHMAIIETHLFSNMTSAGIADSTASYLFSLYGLTTIIGSVITGALGSRFPMKWVAGVTFTSRILIIGGFLLMPKTIPTFAAFSLLLGLTGAATVPPVSGMTGKLFGAASLGTLFGILFVAHQLGSFFSSWLGGISITATGSYTTIWLVSGALALLAGCACFMVKEPEAFKGGETQRGL